VVLETDPSVVEDPLVSVIRERVVQRRPMSPKPILREQRRALEHAAQPYSVIWLDSWSARAGMASLNARNAHIRLTIPEAYAVHKAVIAWNCETSEDRLPAASLGADPILLGIMRWVMTSWERLSFFHRYLGGTVCRDCSWIFCRAFCAVRISRYSDRVSREALRIASLPGAPSNGSGSPRRN